MHYWSFLFDDYWCFMIDAWWLFSPDANNDTEIRINGKRTDSFGGGVWDSIIINKSWISWIITTLRTATVSDYETWKKFIKNKYKNCELMLIMNPRETDYSYLKILPFWSEEKKLLLE